MATISENLQILKNSTDAIKQAIIDKGGTIEGDITTWADAINGISGGSSSKEIKTVFIGNTTRVYEDGMTWSEYIDSVYNTIDDTYGKLSKPGGDAGVIVSTNGMGYLLKDNGAVMVFASHLIDNSITYIISHAN